MKTCSESKQVEEMEKSQKFIGDEQFHELLESLETVIRIREERAYKNGKYYGELGSEAFAVIAALLTGLIGYFIGLIVAGLSQM